MQTPTSPQGVGNELKSDAKNMASTAVNRVHSEVDARKGDAASQVKSVSSALDQAAGGLEANSPEWLKSALRSASEQIGKFADTIERKDSRQLVGDVSEFARSSPGTFLAACAAAGFAAARVIKAGGEGNRPTQPGPVGTIGQTSSSPSYPASGTPVSRAQEHIL